MLLDELGTPRERILLFQLTVGLEVFAGNLVSRGRRSQLWTASGETIPTNASLLVIALRQVHFILG